MLIPYQTDLTDLTHQTDQTYVQHPGAQHADACAGFVARTNALMKRPSIDSAISGSTPAVSRNARASAAR